VAFHSKEASSVHFISLWEGIQAVRVSPVSSRLAPILCSCDDGKDELVHDDVAVPDNRTLEIVGANIRGRLDLVDYRCWI
jgi:hypothetical protein